MSEEVSIDKQDVKRSAKGVLDFFKQKKVQNIIIIILLVGLIIFASSMRVQNMDLLEDQTTGKKIPLALDPFYFLRVAETKVANGGTLPEVDSFRSPVVADREFTNEILPDAVIGLWKTGKIFDPSFTLRHADVVSPVVFFALGILVFFFLVYALTRNKWTALGSSAILAFVPSYLYRTMAGFADHESIGMFSFILTMLVFSLGMKYLGKVGSKGKKEYYISLAFGVGNGLLSALTVASWGGVANMIPLIFPLAFLIFWLVKDKREREKLSSKAKYLTFYISWAVLFIVSAQVFSFSMGDIIGSYVLSGQGALVPFVLIFSLIDLLTTFVYEKKKEALPEKIRALEKHKTLFSLGATVVLGIIIGLVFESQSSGILGNVVDRLIRPSGTGRLGTTVAENRAPFLSDWVDQVGKMFFWVFMAGLLFIGGNIARKVENKKHGIYFFIAWLVLILGIVFSRISSGSLLDGTNTFSQIVYFGGIFIFLIVAFYVYSKSKIDISAEMTVIASWMFFMLISTRGAIRMFFVIVPFMSFVGIYALQNSIEYWKNNKDRMVKALFIALALLFSILLIFSFVQFVQSTDQQAQRTAPAADGQWQQAMKWVREETPKNSIFGHWWDYGYWVQYLGERASIMDGGFRPEGLHHMFGRYVLTTKEPETALSLMKTHNVSHLLIDSSDLGKYGAYSSIGSGPDRQDRRSQIPTLQLSPSQTRETRNGTTRVYQGGVAVDEDIVYERQNGEKAFLPKGKAALGGVVVKSKENKNGTEIEQPEGIFIYKGQQLRIPLKNIYFRGKHYSFDEGIDATVRIVPTVSRGGAGARASINQFGGAIYLSPRTSGTLFAELYLMDDPKNKYPSIEVAHKQQDRLVENFKRQGADIGEFLMYQGFRGPIKIWNVSYPESVVRNEKLLKQPQPYGSYDNITFSR